MGILHVILVYSVLGFWASDSSTDEPGPCANSGSGVIFCDDFESPEPLEKRYFGYDDDQGEFLRMEGVGRNGSAGMRVRWQKGEVEAGVLQKAIGRSPDAKMIHAAAPDSVFTEIYWHIDIKHQEGWEGGGGDKLSRATSIMSPQWQQGMIAHVWSGGKAPHSDYLVIDPASGIDTNGIIRSTRYNDFANLRWMGGQVGKDAIFTTLNSGNWYCVTARAKLNSPGNADGIFELWIDKKLQASRRNINWHGNRTEYGINAVFFENYWNNGAAKDQERYFDNIIISTQPINCHFD